MHARDLRGRVRAGLIGGALITLTLAGHTAAGGALDAMGTALVVALALAFGSATVRVRLPLALLLGVLAAGQGLLHLILTVAGSHAHAAAVTATAPSPSTMLLAHTFATLLAAAVILRIDGLVERWLRFVRAVLGWAMHLAPVPAAHSTAAVTGHDIPIALLVLRHGVSRRGPPRDCVPALA